MNDVNRPAALALAEAINSTERAFSQLGISTHSYEREQLEFALRRMRSVYEKLTAPSGDG